MRQYTPETEIEMYYVEYGTTEEGEVVCSWDVEITREDGFTAVSPWDTYEDAEWFFNENRQLYVNVERM